MQPSQSPPPPPPHDADGEEESETPDTGRDASAPSVSGVSPPHPPMAVPPGGETIASLPPGALPSDASDVREPAALYPAFTADLPSLAANPATDVATPDEAKYGAYDPVALPIPLTSSSGYPPPYSGGASALPYAAPFALGAATPVPVQSSAIPRRSVGPFIAVVGVSTLGAVLCAFLGYVSRGFAARDQLSFELFTLDGLRFWLPGLALALLTGAAVLLAAGRRASPGLAPGTAWIFPFVAMCAGLLVISVYHDRPWWFVAPVVTWVALIVGTVARLFLAEPSGGGHDIARTMLTIISYVIAFLALAMIYINKLRSIFSATAVVVICVLLLLQMTDGETASLPRRLVYAIAGGLIIGQVTWVINYWSAAGWTGGAFLLAVFYLIAGLSAAQLRDHIGLFDVIEFGGVALLALAIVSAAVLYQS